MKKIFIPILILLISLSLKAETIRISTVEGLPLSEICSYILERVYEKAGLELEIVPMPPARAIRESTSGRIDGETHRIESYGDNNPELVRVPFSHYSIQVILYTDFDNPARLSTYDEFPQYRFSILRGIKNSKELTSGFPNVHIVDDAMTMFQLLKLGRIDFAVTSNIFGDSFLRRNGIDGIVAHSTPLQTTELYHYLHKDHSEVASIIDKTLRKMDASGELDRIKKEAEKIVSGEN